MAKTEKKQKIEQKGVRYKYRASGFALLLPELALWPRAPAISPLNIALCLSLSPLFSLSLSLSSCKSPLSLSYALS